MDGISVRRATPEDTVAVEDYHDRCFRDTYAAQLLAGEFEAPDRKGTREQLRNWFEPDSGIETTVAIANDKPIGHFTVHANQLVNLFVEPDYQHIGLGTWLLALAEAEIAAGGHSNFELHTRVENLFAIAFYLRRGWVMTEDRIHTVEHRINYHEHVMVKHHL